MRPMPQRMIGFGLPSISRKRWSDFRRIATECARLPLSERHLSAISAANSSWACFRNLLALLFSCVCSSDTTCSNVRRMMKRRKLHGQVDTWVSWERKDVATKN